VEGEIEWLYAFDIHCNAFFPVFVLLYVVQYFFAPVLIQPDFMATVAANLLYAGAFSYYHYVSFLGYSGTSSSPLCCMAHLSHPSFCLC